MEIKIFDSHTHTNSQELIGEFEQIKAQCFQQGIAFNIIGTTIEDSQIAVAQAKASPYLYATNGDHPNDCVELDLEATKQSLVEMLENDAEHKIVAIGECGLDKHFSEEHFAKQQAFFKMQMELAIKYDRALMCHIRDAHWEAIAMFKEQCPERTIIHCFTGDEAIAQEYVKMGCYISLSGVVTFKNSTSIREALKVVPQTLFLIETDAPYLTPVPFRGKKNYPYFVIHTAKFVAEFLGVDFAQFLAQKTQNARKVFKI